MEFEDHLRRSLDAVADRVRARLVEELSPVVSELTAAAVERGQTTQSALVRVLGACETIDRARSLTEILEALAAAAAVEAGRAGAFVLEGAHFRAWGLAGFDRLQNLEIGFADSGMLADSMESGRRIEIPESSPKGAAPPFASLAAGRHAVAVPLVMTGQVFGVLYADEGASGVTRPSEWTAVLEVLARYASKSMEAMTAQRLAQVRPADDRLRRTPETATDSMTLER